MEKVPSPTPLPPARVWTREEYERAIDAGLFGADERLELLEGVIVCKMPQNSPHATGITLLQRSFTTRFTQGYVIRIQLPLALQDSEPEPDVAVVPGAIRDFTHHHPRTASLVVEVADSSLDVDRMTKGSIYAKAGLPEYWILNLIDGCLEVYRDPAADPEQPIGFRYASITTLQREDSVTCLAAPHAPVLVADLLP